MTAQNGVSDVASTTPHPVLIWSDPSEDVVPVNTVVVAVVVVVIGVAAALVVIGLILIL